MLAEIEFLAHIGLDQFSLLVRIRLQLNSRFYIGDTAEASRRLIGGKDAKHSRDTS